MEGSPALPCIPARESLGQPQKGIAATLQPPGAKPQEPRGNSCGEHLAELEYALSFLGMEIHITQGIMSPLGRALRLDPCASPVLWCF